MGDGPKVGATTAANPFAANVWSDTNRVSSDGRVGEVTLTDILPGAQEPVGTWARVDGQTKLGGIFKWDPFPKPTDPPPQPPSPATEPPAISFRPRRPFEAEMPLSSFPTVDGFDQVQLYNALTGMQLYLVGKGFDIAAIIGTSHEGRRHAMAAHANAVEDLNAWYSPQSDDLTFGTAGGKWHLASDNDISIHEGGHLLLGHINRDLSGWFSGEGGAIHEGFGDALAALLANDPELSEDFPPAMGEPPDKTKGLRTVDHALAIRDVGSEVHDRGRVYGGFFWGVKKRLEGHGKSPREAADIALRILVNHGAFYRTRRPKPVDFVDAVIAGAEALANEPRGLGLPFETIRSEIVGEATARGMVEGPAPLAKSLFAARPSLIDAGEIIEFYRRQSPRLTFTPAGVSLARGGRREDYQEWFATADGRKARVVGSGFFLHRDAVGKVIHVSSDDIRILKDGDVVEETRVSPLQALRAVQAKAGQELTGARREKMRFERRSVRTPQDLAALKKAQMRYRMAFAATERARQLSERSAELVILPGERELSYEFKMGLSLYYVNARTGKVRVEADVMWD